jgi:hypothetical protein
MSDTYEAKILADSISPDGVRLTTIQATYPRFIHSEVMTHRAFGRNAASSRAIPTEKNIERVRDSPFVPETFHARVKGMGYGDELESEKQEDARQQWLAASEAAAVHAARLNNIGIDKSRANRLLEPFVWMTTIITSTEWENFFALRQPRNNDPVPQQDFPAQPEFQIVARMMRDAMEASEPQPLGFEGKVYERWHMPLVIRDEKIAEFDSETMDVETFWPMVSAGRCARVSFDTHENYEEPPKSHGRSDGLKTNGHMSPFEHVARPITPDDMDPEVGAPIQNKLMIPIASANRAVHQGLRGGDVWCGNLRGWVPLRKMIPSEDNFGELIAA